MSASKKKLQKFLQELLQIGAVKGFQHFTMHPRGREELICCIRNESLTATPGSSPAHSLSSSYEQQSSSLPRNQQSLLLSVGTQKRLSGYGFINIGLPPASPSDREVFHADDNMTVFLVAAYQRYNCPYVWVRSNHERLVRLSGSGSTAKDNPLKLQSTSYWSEKEVQPWDIIGELVQLCMQPAPVNPFAVDMAYFESLTHSECALATGAMAYLLQRLLLSRTHSYDHKILEDLRRVLQLHFTSMSRIAAEPAAASAQPAVPTGPTSMASPQVFYQPRNQTSAQIPYLPRNQVQPQFTERASYTAPSSAQGQPPSGFHQVSPAVALGYARVM